MTAVPRCKNDDSEPTRRFRRGHDNHEQHKNLAVEFPWLGLENATNARFTALSSNSIDMKKSWMSLYHRHLFFFILTQRCARLNPTQHRHLSGSIIAVGTTQRLFACAKHQRAHERHQESYDHVNSNGDTTVCKSSSLERSDSYFDPKSVRVPRRSSQLCRAMNHRGGDASRQRQRHTRQSARPSHQLPKNGYALPRLRFL